MPSCSGRPRGGSRSPDPQASRAALAPLEQLGCSACIAVRLAQRSEGRTLLAAATPAAAARGPVALLAGRMHKEHKEPPRRSRHLLIAAVLLAAAVVALRSSAGVLNAEIVSAYSKTYADAAAAASARLSAAATAGLQPVCTTRPSVRGYRASTWEQEW